MTIKNNKMTRKKSLTEADFRRIAFGYSMIMSNAFPFVINYIAVNPCLRLNSDANYCH